jgi:hypothetical protein
MKTNPYAHSLFQKLFAGNRFFILSTAILGVMLFGLAKVHGL